MSTRNIAYSTLWQMASQIAMAALSILTVKFVAIGLSKELAGTYNSAYGFLQLFGILADFGLYAVAVREVSAAKNKSEVFGAILVLRSMVLALSLGSALLFAWLMPLWRGTPLPMGISIAALVPFFTLLAGVIRTVFQVHYKMHLIFIAEVAQRTVATVAIGLCIYSGVRNSTDTFYYNLFLAFGGLGALILFLVSAFFGGRIMSIRPNFNKKLIVSIFKKSLPYGVAFLCVALYRNLDVTLIALLREDYELQNAYYGFVLRMVEMGFIIPTFLLNSTLPTLSKREADGEDVGPLLGKTLFIILLLGSVSFLFSFFWARPLVLLLTTEAYVSVPGTPGSDTALRYMSLPILLNGLVIYSFYVLLAKNEWKWLTRILFAAAMFSLVCNIILIPPLGFRGAAITSVVTHILLVCALLPHALKAMPCTILRSHILQWFSFSALLAGALYLGRPLLLSGIHTAAGLAAMGIFIPLAAGLLGIHKSLIQIPSKS